ncbi:MAG: hypothetical protein M1827_006808 [Pycnora praestabilis]|nr:MAG: hypothetical protein M1827_006808 [Pycnora praestabilis]
MATSQAPPASLRGQGHAPGAPSNPHPVSPTQQQEVSRTRSRGSSGASGRLRRASITFMESNPPVGFMSATGELAAQAPSVNDIRYGGFGASGWKDEEQRVRRNSVIGEDGSSRTRRPSASRGLSKWSTTEQGPGKGALAETAAEHEEEEVGPEGIASDPISKARTRTSTSPRDSVISGDAPTKSPAIATETQYANGYTPPPKHTWGQATTIGLKSFWRFFLTPLGFCVVIYGLNVVAWGGMLFLLLIGGGKAMCHPSCNDINSARRKWIEVDSQILNALFCVTGFGLIPWRFRDLYYLMQFRIKKNNDGLRRLAGLNRSWFRLPGSDRLDNRDGLDGNEDDMSLPLPLSSAPDPPLTGFRAPPTPIWKMDFVVWAFIVNTALQAVLSGFMWGLNRYNRPSWSTGLFVALACIVAACGGLMGFQEGKKVKKIEGIPPSEYDVIKDVEQGSGKLSEKHGKHKDKTGGVFGHHAKDSKDSAMELS